MKKRLLKKLDDHALSYFLRAAGHSGRAAIRAERKYNGSFAAFGLDCRRAASEAMRSSDWRWVYGSCE